MRLRIYVAFGVVVAAGIAAALWAVTRSSPPPSAPASPLDAARALTCPGQGRNCTSPGTVRWSAPLQAAALDGDIGTVDTPSSFELAMLNALGMRHLPPALVAVRRARAGPVSMPAEMMM